MRVAHRSVVPLAVTLGLTALAWVVTVRQMRGMDMGVATQLGSFAFFVALWAAMMAAMMLPGLVPAVLSRGRSTGPVRAVVPFVASYSSSGRSSALSCTRCIARTARPPLVSS